MSIGGGSGRKAPVGTQNYWESTGATMIKTHDNTIFDDIISPWIPLPQTEEHWLQRFRELDRKASYILTYKEPVEGELWLDKEISEFKTSSGKTFSPSDLKQFKSFGGGLAGYSFTEELIKRREWNRINLQAKIAEALVEANENKKYEGAKRGESFDDTQKTFLTKDEIKEIKEQVKTNYKEDTSQHISKEDVDEIQKLLDRVLGYLERGENFEGDQAAVYEEGKALINRLLNGEYNPLSEIRVITREYLQKMDKVFKDAWGVRESYRKKLDSSFTKYISRFRTQIEKEELEVFKQVVGVDLYAPTDEFYGAIAKSKIFEEVNLEDYIGKMVPHPENKYKDVLFERYEDGKMYFVDETATTTVDTDYPNNDNYIGKEQNLRVSQDTLQSLISQREIGSELEIPLKLRFTKLYDKDIQGDFNRGDLTLLRTFEKIGQYLPSGHLLTNPMLRRLRKETYFQNGDNSYAHYQNNKREIYVSNQAAKSNQLGIVDLNRGEELASVLVHEVGHALSERLGRRDSMAYKKFVAECGWTWEQFKLGNRTTNYIATGGQQDIKRHGSKSNVPLITEYSGKSPEEAFAEYYSFYSQYKKHIDKFLTTGNKTHLEKDTIVKIDKSPKDFSHYSQGMWEDSERLKTVVGIDAILTESKRDLKSHIKVTVIDPYLDNLEVTKEKHVPTGKIVYNKSERSKNREVPQPVFSIFDAFTGKQDIVNEEGTNDSSVHFANKYLRRVSPTFSISKECYKLLKDKGFSHRQIRDYTLDKVRDEKIPIVKNIDEGEKKGLKYRSDFVDANNLEKMTGIFRSMKGIWESEELQKALEEMGLLETIEEDLLEKSEGSRGGVILGHTPSGKPIYKNSKDSHEGFSRWDHNYTSKYHKKQEENATKNGNSELAKHHQEHSDYHNTVFKKISKHADNIIKENRGLTSDEVEEETTSRTLKKSEDDHTILDFLKPYKEKIKQLLGIKKNQIYGDIVVRNFKGEILILERSMQDDFCPGVWSLPGGKIESGETPIQGTIRELEEETGIKAESVTGLGEKKRTDSTTHYFETFIFDPKLTYLDNEEHYRYQWVKPEDLCNYDLILDLGETLKELPLTEVPSQPLEITEPVFDTIEKRNEDIENGFNLGIISVEEYIVEKGLIARDLFEIVEQGFNEEKVSVEKYLKYKNLTEN